MGFFDFLFEQEPEKRDTADTEARDAGGFVDVSGVGGSFAQIWGSTSFAGEDVTETTALGVPAIAAAVTVISQTIAGLPLHYFRTVGEASEKATSDPLYRRLHDVVNDDFLTSYDWRRWLISRLLLSGRAFTLIERNKVGRVRNLWPLENSKMTVEEIDGRRRYTYNSATGRVTYTASEIIDLVYQPGADCFSHISPIHQHRNSIGAMIAAERSSSIMFENGGIVPLVLTGPTTNAGAERASADIQGKLKTARAEKKQVLVIPKDHELKPIGLDPQKQQLLELRAAQVTEVARIFNLPPTFLQDHSKSTFSNVESLNLHFAQHTILPLVTMIEAELNAKLVGGWANFIKFNLDGLQRSDFAGRTTGYATMHRIGAMTTNDIRAKEDLPPLPGGDVPMVQGAMVPLLDAGKFFDPAATPKTIPDDQDPASPGTGDQ